MGTALQRLDTATGIRFETADGREGGTIEGDGLDLARRTAERRQGDAVQAGRHDAHGFDGADGRRVHLLGALGELAVARLLQIPWSASVNTFKAPDLADFIQVRTRSKHAYDLLVRPNDKDDEVFFHVTADLYATPPLLVVHGCIAARAAKRPGFLARHGGRAQAYFVPADELVPMADILADTATSPESGMHVA